LEVERRGGVKARSEREVGIQTALCRLGSPRVNSADKSGQKIDLIFKGSNLRPLGVSSDTFRGVSERLFEAGKFTKGRRVCAIPCREVIETNGHIVWPGGVINGPRGERRVRAVGSNPSSKPDRAVVREALNPSKRGAEPLVSELGGGMVVGVDSINAREGDRRVRSLGGGTTGEIGLVKLSKGVRGEEAPTEELSLLEVIGGGVLAPTNAVRGMHNEVKVPCEHGKGSITGGNLRKVSVISGRTLGKVAGFRVNDPNVETSLLAPGPEDCHAAGNDFHEMMGFESPEKGVVGNNTHTSLSGGTMGPEGGGARKFVGRGQGTRLRGVGLLKNFKVGSGTVRNGFIEVGAHLAGTARKEGSGVPRDARKATLKRKSEFIRRGGNRGAGERIEAGLAIPGEGGGRGGGGRG